MEPLRWRLVQHVHWESRISVEGLSLISLIGTFNRSILSDDILNRKCLCIFPKIKWEQRGFQMLYLKPDTLLVLDPNPLMKHGHTAPSGQHKSACAAIVAPPARGPRWRDGLFAYLCAPVQKTWRYVDACVLLLKFAVRGTVFSCKSSCACTTGGFPGRTYRLTPPAAPPCLAAALRVEIKDFSCFYVEQTDPMFSNTSKTTHDYTDSECQDGAVTLWHNGSVLTKWLFWLYLAEGVLRKNTVDSG